MNQKLLIIFILVVLIVLVGCLILNKKPSDSFHEGNCDDLSTNVCELHFEDTCRIHKKGTADAVCKYKCKFKPDRVFDNPEEHSDYGMVTRQVDDKTVFEFPTEEDGAGAYGSCFSKCREIQNDETLENSFCTTEECKVSCRDYVLRKVEENNRTNIRYESCPTDKISEEKYDEIRETVISKMVEPEFRDYIRDIIYGGDISREMTEQVNLQEKARELQSTLEAIQNLESTGSDFITQIDQMGAFQDKYSNKIESLLNEKRESNTALDRKLLGMSNKIEMLKKLYSDFDSTDSQDTNNTFKSYYTSGTSLSNGTKIYFTPVKYNVGTTTNPSFKFFKNGAYLVNRGRDASNNNKFLFLEPLKNDSDGNQIFCNPNDLECSYKLTEGTNRGAEEISQVSSESNVIGELYPSQSSDDQSKFQHKKHAYFNIIEIKNNEQYNSIILKTPNGSNNLVRPNDIIKYPFFVIESLELPGFLINIVTNENDDKHIKLFPASKKGSEKFLVNNLVSTSTDSRCAATTGGGTTGGGGP